MSTQTKLVKVTIPLLGKYKLLHSLNCCACPRFRSKYRCVYTNGVFYKKIENETGLKFNQAPTSIYDWWIENFYTTLPSGLTIELIKYEQRTRGRIPTLIGKLHKKDNPGWMTFNLQIDFEELNKITLVEIP